MWIDVTWYNVTWCDVTWYDVTWYNVTWYLQLRKIPSFYLISWCANFVERHKHSFHIVLGESSETVRKLCLLTKFPHMEIGWNFHILYSVQLRNLFRSSGRKGFYNSSIHSYCYDEHLKSFTTFFLICFELNIFLDPCKSLICIYSNFEFSERNIVIFCPKFRVPV